jgi:O-antigen ligase
MILLLFCYGGLDLVTLRSGDRTRLKRLAVAAFVVLVLIVGGRQFFERTDLGHKFARKLSRSVEEVASQDFGSPDDITRHWRGYETHRAWIAYREGGPVELLVGQGYGKLLDTGMRVPLGGELMQYLPTVHNGYSDLLLKTGIVGIACYVLFFLRLFVFGYRRSKADRRDLVLCGRLLMGSCVAVLAMTIPISGLMNKVSLNPATLLLGALTAYCLRVEVEVAAQKGAVVEAEE